MKTNTKKLLKSVLIAFALITGIVLISRAPLSNGKTVGQTVHDGITEVVERVKDTLGFGDKDEDKNENEGDKPVETPVEETENTDETHNG